MRSVNSSKLSIKGVVTVPVKVYKGFSSYQLDTHRYYPCGTQMKMSAFCPVHEDGCGEAFSGMQIGDKIVPVPPEFRDELLGKRTNMTIKSYIAMRDLHHLLMETMVVENYRVMPDGIDDVDTTHRTMFGALLRAMRRRNRALHVVVGLGGLERNAILLPDGRLLALSYQEEMIVFPGWSGPNISQVNGYMLNFIDGLVEMKNYRFTLSKITSSVENWIASFNKPRTNPKKSNTKERVTEHA